MTTSDAISELVAATRRIEQLVEILAKLSLRQVMAEELSDPIAEALYKATGTKTITEISAEIGWSAATISRTWTRWNRLGLLVKNGRSYRRTFDEEGAPPRLDKREAAKGRPAARKITASEPLDGEDLLVERAVGRDKHE
jgi:hypothetical protein